MRQPASIMVTGGAGFMGSGFIRHLMDRPAFAGRVVNVDLLTYAGNPANVADVAGRFGDSRYRFSRLDIADEGAITRLLREHDIDTIVHFAAETHVDRSIAGAGSFVRTNVEGTRSLLAAASAAWSHRPEGRFHLISTDEVYGPQEKGAARESASFSPRNPYAATKAAAEHLAMAWHHTHGLSVTISRACNNYGPCQFPEKLIPFMILALLEGRDLPLYGDGRQVRQWLHVADHSDAVWRIMTGGEAGSIYNVGGDDLRENRDLVDRLCGMVAAMAGLDAAACRRRVTMVSDRPGHDRRYCLDAGLLRAQLGWAPAISLDAGLGATVQWYLDNPAWIDGVRSGEYRRWIADNYDAR